MSLTHSALHGKGGPAFNKDSPIPSTANSVADSDAETMSDAASSDSGNSIEIGGTHESARALREDRAHANRMRDIFLKKEKSAALTRDIATAVAKFQREDPLDGARSYCSMCSINPSEYLCTHCGRLSFCTKCCLNLHDNKYLSGHSFQILDSIPQGEQCALDDIKKKKQMREEEERSARKMLQSSVVIRQPEGAPLVDPSVLQKSNAASAAGKTRLDGDGIDMASLTADKSVINVRLNELRTCLRAGQELHRELASERNTTKETTATAVEAVRRRFDVLRQLINSKEEQFVAVVEQAGKERFDLATAATCSISIATSELDGFISHMALQMDRLEENRVQFDAQRHGILETTFNKLSNVDGWTHDHQSRLQEIRSMSLGVHVPIDGAAEAIQLIQPPKYLTHRATEEGKQGILSIQEAASLPVGEILSPAKTRQGGAVAAAKFVDTPGVKVIVQTQIKRPVQAGMSSSRHGSPLTMANQAPPEGRKLHTVEQQELRNTPMREIVRPQWKEQSNAARKAASPVRAASVSTSLGASAIYNTNQNQSTISALNASSISIPTGNSRQGTPTRRVMYGRSDSNASNGPAAMGMSRPSVVPRAQTSKANDLYAQRVVSAAIKTTTQRALSPGGTSQRFTTSPHRAVTSPHRAVTSPLRQTGTSSFALPTGTVRRGGSPMRGGAAPVPSSHTQQGASNSSPMHRGSTDNPGPGAYNIPTSSFTAARKVASPMRR